MLFGMFFNRWPINVDDSRQLTIAKESYIVAEWGKVPQLRHWSVASPSWMRRPAARRTH